MKKYFISTGFILASLFIFIGIVQSSPVNAADANNFNAGRIIDDGVFTNADSMSVVNIQSFLNSKVTCDTYGTKPSEFGGGTRAQWLAANGVSVPVTCLRDYYENPTTGENNFGKAIPAGAISAAQIIYNYALQFNINPQVIIVTLQKENGLVTDEWPTPKEYSQAMGFACPDNTAPGAPACDPAYGSFSAQIYQAARHFRGYINNAPGWWVPFTNGPNTIQFSPTASCGGSTVNIENRATVALYSYTPYQPNTAAKNAQYGHGDSCSSYGNRNFYLYFTDWFGSTYGGDPVSSDLKITSPITVSPSQPIPGQITTVSYTVKNFSSQAVTYDYSVLQCRLNTYGNCDTAIGPSVTLNAGETRTFTQNVTLQQGGDYIFTPFFFRAGLWTRFGTQDTGTNTLRTNVPDMRITSPITFSPASPQAGAPVAVDFTIKNFGTNPVVYQTSVLQCRYNTATNCDSTYGGGVTIQPNSSLPVEYYLTPTNGGSYIFTPYYMEDGTWYQYNAINGASPNSLSTDIPDVRLTSEITSSIAQPIPGQTTTISYTAKNFGTQAVVYDNSLLQCRLNNSVNCDTPPASTITLASGEEKTFTYTIPITKAGNYTLVPYFLKNGSWYQYSKGTATKNTLALNVPRYVADLRLTSAIDSSPVTPIPGQNVTLTYTVKNFGDLPAIYQDSVLQCRINGVTNCDTGFEGAFTIAAGASKTFTETMVAPKSGTYSLRPFFMQNESWYGYGPDPLYAWRDMVVPAYVADMRLTSPISISPVTDGVATVTYTVKNFGDLPAIYQDSVLQCRRNATVNCDSTYGGTLTIAAGASKTFTHTIQVTANGTYTFVPFLLQNSTWLRYNAGTTTSNQLVVTI